MTCPCHRVQTSLVNSLGSTLICPPVAAEHQRWSSFTSALTTSGVVAFSRQRTSRHEPPRGIPAPAGAPRFQRSTVCYGRPQQTLCAGELLVQLRCCEHLPGGALVVSYLVAGILGTPRWPSRLCRRARSMAPEMLTTVNSRGSVTMITRPWACSVSAARKMSTSE
jgi:hypothetical protein